MKNILHLTETSEPGGSETVLAYIASHLDPSRFRSHVCLIQEGWLTDHLRELGVDYRIIENKWSYDPAFLFNLIRLIRRERIDLLHSHEFMMNVYGSVAAKLTGIPMIGTLHGKVYFTEKRSRIKAYKLAISLSSYFIAVSRDLKKYLIESLDLKRDDKILTIYNGIDIDKYRIETYPNDLAEDLDIRPGMPVIGTVGSLFEVKGLEYLLEATQIVKETVPELRLLITGTGRLENELKALAGELGIAETVKFLGFRGDIPKLLNLMDVYICSSVSEGLSLSILEAMACGRSIVATDVGGNPELITEGISGFLVPSRDPLALAQKVIQLLHDRELRSRLGGAGRQIVEEKFSLETMMQNYYKLYGKLLG